MTFSHLIIRIKKNGSSNKEEIRRRNTAEIIIRLDFTDPMTSFKEYVRNAEVSTIIWPKA